MSEANDHRPQRRTKAGRLVSSVTLEELQSYFHLPSEKACKELGVGLTILKRICRKLGIPRWPYNRVPKNAGAQPSESSSLNSPRSSGPSPSGAAAATNHNHNHNHHVAASPTAATRLAQRQLPLSDLLQLVAARPGTGAPPPAADLPAGTHAGAGTSGPYPNPALFTQLLLLLQQQQQQQQQLQQPAGPTAAAAAALAGGAAASSLGHLVELLDGASLPGMQHEGGELLCLQPNAAQLSSESVWTSAPLNSVLEASLPAPQSLPRAGPAPLTFPSLPLLPLQQQQQQQLQVPELQQLLGMLGGLPAAQGHQLLPALGSTATAVAALQQEQRQHLEHQQQQFVQQQEEQQRQRQLEEAVDLLHSMLRQRAAAGAHPTSHTLGNNSARSPPLAEGAAGGSGASRSGPQHSEPEAGGVVRPKALSLPLLSNLNAGLASQLTQSLLNQGSTEALPSRPKGPQHAQQPLQLYQPSRAPSAATWPAQATAGATGFLAAAAAAQQALQAQQQGPGQGQVDLLALLLQQVSAVGDQQQQGQQQQQQQQPRPDT